MVWRGRLARQRAWKAAAALESEEAEAEAESHAALDEEVIRATSSRSGKEVRRTPSPRSKIGQSVPPKE